MIGKLFARLRKIREFERRELTFLESLIDFDIVIEIGYAEEQKQPLTPRQLFLLKRGSLTTMRRRLAKLIAQGIVTQHKGADNHRSAILTIAPSSLKLLGKYGRVLATISAPA